MPSHRLVALALVVAVASGCSSTRASSPAPTSDATPSGSAPSLATATAPPSPVPLPSHHVLAGPNVVGAFDAATDGSAIAWSNGTVDVDAPDLWSFDPLTGALRLVYRSAVPGAILANLAVWRGAYAFAEVTPRRDGSRTWRLLLLDPSGAVHVLDVNDVPPAQAGVLPMVALSDAGALWAASHAGDAVSPRCELRYASFAEPSPRVVRAAPCSAVEAWYPRSDGRSFVYGTVEYAADGATDDRHVYLATAADLAHPRRLDVDGAASLPAVLADTVVWKTARHDLNMFSPGGLVELSLAPGGSPTAVPLGSPASPQLTVPSLGPAFVTSEDASGEAVQAFDRRRARTIDVDRLPALDPGFLSGTRLAGDLLIWFYTSSTQGGGSREIRWLMLAPT